MKKPIYYLWKKDFKNEKQYEKIKEIFKNAGFHVAVFDMTEDSKEERKKE